MLYEVSKLQVRNISKKSKKRQGIDGLHESDTQWKELHSRFIRQFLDATIDSASGN